MALARAPGEHNRGVADGELLEDVRMETAPRIDDESGRAALATVRAAGVGNVGVAEPGDLGSAPDRAWVQNSPVADQDPLTRVDPGEGVPAVPVDHATVETAVRYTMQLLTERAPGDAIEVRVPPYGIGRCVDDRRPRGSLPDIVETDAATWLLLATGDLDWGTTLSSGQVRVSGDRADLAPHLPVISIP